MNRWIPLALFFLVLSVSLPDPAMSQQPPGMDPARMQEMMKQMQDPAVMQRMQQQAEASQACMKEIDPNRLEALKARGEAVVGGRSKRCARRARRTRRSHEASPSTRS